MILVITFAQKQNSLLNTNESTYIGKFFGMFYSLQNVDSW